MTSIWWDLSLGWRLATIAVATFAAIALIGGGWIVVALIRDICRLEDR